MSVHPKQPPWPQEGESYTLEQVMWALHIARYVQQKKDEEADTLWAERKGFTISDPHTRTMELGQTNGKYGTPWNIHNYGAAQERARIRSERIRQELGLPQYREARPTIKFTKSLLTTREVFIRYPYLVYNNLYRATSALYQGSLKPENRFPLNAYWTHTGGRNLYFKPDEVDKWYNSLATKLKKPYTSNPGETE